MKIAFVGKGELSIQIENYLELPNNIDILYFDDSIIHDNIKRFPFSRWSNKIFKDYNFVFCIGYKNLSRRSEIIQEAHELKRNILNYIHPTSFVNKSAKIGMGVFIYPMCNIDKGVLIENGVVINNSVTVSHDTSLGKSTYISPGVVICGNVTIGKNCFIGAGTTISNSIRIGNNVTVGIGSNVTIDIPDNSHVIGNPLRFLSTPIKLI